MRTIQTRLVAGFGASISLLLIAGLLGWYGLQRNTAQSDRTIEGLTIRSESTERTITTILRELTAGLRYLNTRTTADADNYQKLVTAADSLRRMSIQQESLRPDERKVLETVGQLQAALEVRIATTHAYQVVGREAEAQRVLGLTTRDIDAIEAQLELLRVAAREGATQDVVYMRADLKTSEWAFGVVVAIAFLTAAFFGVSTSEAVTQPLGKLREEMAAIGVGDLRLPKSPERKSNRPVAQEYADLIGDMEQARERLRSLLSNVQGEADQVTLAAGELSSSASAAAASSQHVTTAVMDISHGASL
ncbi:MAG: hypothetical protein ABJC26_17440, partial [Gemmatimonadaceae bacterium]